MVIFWDKHIKKFGRGLGAPRGPQRDKTGKEFIL